MHALATCQYLYVACFKIRWVHTALQLESRGVSKREQLVASEERRLADFEVRLAAKERALQEEKEQLTKVCCEWCHNRCVCLPASAQRAY